MLPNLPLAEVAARNHNTTISRDNMFLIKLAREIASDMRSLEDILRTFLLTTDEWEAIQQDGRFQKLLAGAIEEWGAIGNTAERVKTKSMHFVEEALPELYARLHDNKELLSAKVELIKTVSKLAGLGVAEGSAGSGERLTVTINLGDDHKLTFAKDITPSPAAIEGDDE